VFLLHMLESFLFVLLICGMIFANAEFMGDSLLAVMQLLMVAHAEFFSLLW
jgi:hypothetical protein